MHEIVCTKATDVFVTFDQARATGSSKSCLPLGSGALIGHQPRDLCQVHLDFRNIA